MKPSTLTSPLLLLAVSALAASAQTAATHTTTAHPATATHTAATHAAAGGCITLPTISPSIPALPTCPKALFTITRHNLISLDYKSPIITGDTLEDTFGTKPTTITMGFIDEKIGTGEAIHAGMYLSVKYTGYLPDGTKFDSTSDHGGDPFTFHYGQDRVIPGWNVGFEGMRVGGKRRLFIPYQLAYGDQGQAKIPARSLLIFDMEVVSESATPPAPKTPPAPPAKPMPASPAGASAPPPVNPTTPPASTAPATTAAPTPKPETK